MLTKKLSDFIILPVLLAMFLDAVFTLLGKPQQYWNSANFIVDGIPQTYTQITSNPIYFIGAVAIYIVTIIMIIKMLPHQPKLLLGVFMLLLHTYKSNEWVPILFTKYKISTIPIENSYLTLGYFALVSLISSIFIYNHIKDSTKIGIGKNVK